MGGLLSSLIAHNVGSHNLGYNIAQHASDGGLVACWETNVGFFGVKE